MKSYSFPSANKCLALIILMKVQFMFAQTTTNCQTQHTTFFSPASIQSNNCDNLLNYIAPVTGDRVVEVNVRFWVFAPTATATGVWTQPGHVSTAADAQIALDTVNRYFSKMRYPIPPPPVGVDTVRNPRIKFILKSFSVVANPTAYSSVSYVFTNNPAYNPSDAINLYFADCEGGGSYCACDTYTPDGFPHTTPDNYAMFRPDFSGGTNWDNVNKRGGAIAHEICHVFGLSGTNAYALSGGGYYFTNSWALPNFGCCSQVHPQDFTWDYTQNGGALGCIGYGGTGTNNLINENASCGNDILSPQQAGLIHYNLRTALLSILTSNGYTAATTVNHTFDHIVSANEIWQNGDRYMKGDILVKAGKSLTIKCGVAMTNGAKIVVEKTGLLVVDGGTITNISGRTWDGIHVYGDPTLAQTYNTSNSSFAQHQGMVRLINGALISHAYIGVRNHFGNNTNTSTMGGMIFAVNATFLNNRIDVQLLGTNSGSGGVASASRFYGCTFIENGGIGDGYKPLAHVNLYNSKGSCYYGCTFQNTLFYNYGCGIKSVNSTCLVDYWITQQAILKPSIFTALETGIFINNWNPLLTPVVRHSLIKDYFKNGIYSMNNNSLAFRTNTIVPYAGYSTPNISGVYLNNCKYYKINYNVFNRPINVNLNKFDPALAIYKSQAGAHEVFGNTFSGNFMAINVMDDNGNNSDGVKINCNDFHQVPNGYDVALSHTTGLNPPRVMKTQGKVSSNPQPVAAELVRNIYGAICSTQNKWYISSVGPTTIDHGCNINTVTAVTHPTASGCKSPFLNSVEKNISLNYHADCPGTTPSAGGTATNTSQKLENMNAYITALKSDNDENKNHFEIQSTVAGKMALFLNDTLGPQYDSIISVLQNNQGNMSDADLQLIYAYLSMGNYTAASTAVSTLPGSRTDWKNLLEKVLELEQDTVDGIYKLNTDTESRLFFLSYAMSDTLEGKALAQALLKEACDSSYTEPHALPEGEGARPENVTGLSQPAEGDDEDYVEVFPNPTQNGVTVKYIGQSSGPLRIELKDLLGREVFTKFISLDVADIFVPMELLANGMYLLRLIRNEDVFYKTKIIKQE